MKSGTKGLLFILFMGLFLAGMASGVMAQTPVNVEPSSLRADIGGTISIYTAVGVTFPETCTVRLVEYGILETTYVNPTAIQAIVPAGAKAGNYTLHVLDSEGNVIGSGALKLAAPPKPTSTPEPESTPPPGRPILTVRNYTVEPAQVRPGQEFTVSVEVYNNGSRAGENTMVVFPGVTFVPLGDKGHLFWQVHINATFVATQRFRVPTELANGIHNLNVQLSANDWEGAHYDYPTTIPVEVVGSSVGVVPTGKPKILIEDTSTVPTIIAPGTPFTLTLRLANRGSRTAINVMTCADAATALPIQGSSIEAADTIRIDDVITVSLPLLLASGKEGGQQGLTITFEYADYSGGNYSDQQTVSIDVDISLARRPQLLIKNYHTIPENISPGDSFTLTLSLTNVGGGEAQRLMLALGGEEGEELGAFVPVEGSNASFIASIAAGATEVVTMRMMAAGNAETKVHNLPVALAYDTGSGTREKDTQRISLMVRRRPAFKVSFYRPVEGTAMVGQPFPLPIEVVNTGTARFNISTLEATGAGLEFMGESSTYVGNLDPGASWTLDAMATAIISGTVDVIVNIHYVDDLNQTQVLSQVLTVDVMELPQEFGPDGPMGPDGPLGPGEESLPETLPQKALRFLKGMLGLGS